MHSNLPSQVDFSFLSAPDLHDVAPAADLSPFDRGGSPGSNKSLLLDQECVPNTQRAKATRHGDEWEAGVTDLDANVNDHGPTKQIVPDGGYDPERIMRWKAPPRRYFRTFWRSISFRLLKRWADTAKQSRKAGACSI